MYIASVDRLLLAIEIVHSLQYNESISNQDMQLCMNDFVQMYTDCGVSRNPSKQADKHYGQHKSCRLANIIPREAWPYRNITIVRL